MTSKFNIVVLYNTLLQQELAIPPIAEGKSVVLAAETGSGKTVTYLAPVISQLLHRQQAHPRPQNLDR